MLRSSPDLRTLVIGLVAAFLVSSTVPVASASIWDGSNLVVCNSGCDFSSIQAAVDAAEPGDSVLVHEGTVYQESVVVTTPMIQIQGIGSRKPIVNAGTDRVLEIRASAVIIRNLQLEGSDILIDNATEVSFNLNYMVLGTGSLAVTNAQLKMRHSTVLQSMTTQSTAPAIRVSGAGSNGLDIDTTSITARKGGIDLVDVSNAHIERTSFSVVRGGYGVRVTSDSHNVTGTRIVDSNFDKVNVGVHVRQQGPAVTDTVLRFNDFGLTSTNRGVVVDGVSLVDAILNFGLVTKVNEGPVLTAPPCVLDDCSLAKFLINSAGLSSSLDQHVGGSAPAVQASAGTPAQPATPTPVPGTTSTLDTEDNDLDVAPSATPSPTLTTKGGAAVTTSSSVGALLSG